MQKLKSWRIKRNGIQVCIEMHWKKSLHLAYSRPQYQELCPPHKVHTAKKKQTYQIIAITLARERGKKGQLLDQWEFRDRTVNGKFKTFTFKYYSQSNKRSINLKENKNCSSHAKTINMSIECREPNENNNTKMQPQHSECYCNLHDHT